MLVGKSAIFRLPLEVVLPYNAAMRTLRPFILVLTSVATFAFYASAQATKPATSHFTTAISGKALYGKYCAACHGLDGKGAGPAAVALKQRPTDLTQMNRQNGRAFPEERFTNIMNGEAAIAAHGSAVMPVWGDYFRNTTDNPNVVQDRIHALLNYVEELQVK